MPVPTGCPYRSRHVRHLNSPNAEDHQREPEEGRRCPGEAEVLPGDQRVPYGGLPEMGEEMTDEERSLLQAVLVNPFDDLPRLVMADYYDEHGKPDIASFIREQISDPERAIASSEELTMILEHFQPPNLIISSVTMRRGFPDEIHCTIESFMGGGPSPTERTYCISCAGRGEIARMPVQRFVYSQSRDSTVRKLPLPAHDKCEDCDGVGYVPTVREGIAKEIGRRWPITKIVLTDVHPVRSSSRSRRWRFVDRGLARKLVYPGPFSTRQSALSELQRGAVRYMRKLANLPELIHAVS